MLKAFVLGVALFISAIAWAKTVHYDLRATRASVNLSGKKNVDFALQINGSIPAPTLNFTEGDDAEITVTNAIPDEELSIHWHGILLPPEMDGVPYVTTPPIRSGQSLTFRFPIRQTGTYWYHSHTNAQEQLGLYGAIVIQPREKPSIKTDQDLVVMLSDWSDENAEDILKNLRKDGDYYLYKKNSLRSWAGAIAAGRLGTFLTNEWSRMSGMDLSDVGYDAFLINGQRESTLTKPRPGEMIRLRLINAGASTYFYASLGNLPLKVIAADGVDIQPVMAKEILLGMAETYDVLFEMPDQRSYELKITAQDGTGSASTWIGSGEKVFAPIRPQPDLYAEMNHAEHAQHTGLAHAHHHSPSVVDTLTVDQLRANHSTAFSVAPEKITSVKLVLSGDMSRYVWHINGKAIHEDRQIVIHPGDIVRFELVNHTMMHHPMHLHGHFFRVLTDQGQYSPLKHTVDVPPHASRTIEFKADEPGEWMLHCHNLYHLKSGMARVVKYSSFTPSPEIAQWQEHDPHNHDHWYFHGVAELATNHAQLYGRASQTWNQWELRLESNNPGSDYFFSQRKWIRQGDALYRRWLGQNFSLLAGATSFSHTESAVIGASYRLPLLIQSQVFVNHRGKFRLDLEKRFQWTNFLLSDVDFSWRPDQATLAGTHEIEYEATLMIAPEWSWAAGLMFTDDNIGVGVSFQF